jgi:hypothetical protein
MVAARYSTACHWPRPTGSSSQRLVIEPATQDRSTLVRQRPVGGVVSRDREVHHKRKSGYLFDAAH